LATNIIVITGGPSTGKTSLIEHLGRSGYCCYPEISRMIIRAAQEKGITQLFLEDPLLFSEKLLEGRIEQIQTAKNNTNALIFLDRGIPDILAYMEYAATPIPDHFVQACQEHKYGAVFLLPPWAEIHSTDGERYETMVQTREIHEHLKKTYKNYGYTCITVPIGTIETRYQFIENQLKLLLDNGTTH